MRKIFFIVTLLFTQSVLSEEVADTIQLHEVVVMPAKENRPLRKQSISSMSFNAKDIRERDIHDISDLTAVVPGLFIPSYGSAQTTAVYLRGVGSRTNTPRCWSICR